MKNHPPGRSVNPIDRGQIALGQPHPVAVRRETLAGQREHRRRGVDAEDLSGGGPVEQHLGDKARPAAKVVNRAWRHLVDEREQQRQVLGTSWIAREMAGIPGLGERRVLPVLDQAASVPSDSGVLISITSPKRWTVSIAS